MRFLPVVLVLTILACLGTPYASPAEPPPTAREKKQPLTYQVGDLPPPIEVSRWTDGRQHSLSEFRGKVVVIEFTGMWCGVCRKSAPTMRRLVAHYQDQDVVFFGIHTPTDDDQAVAKMMRDDGWPQLIAIDEKVDPASNEVSNGKTAANFGVLGWPTIVVLDRQGRISASGTIVDHTMTPVQAERIYRRCAASAKIDYPMPDGLSDDAKNEWIRQLSFEWHREWIDAALQAR